MEMQVIFAFAPIFPSYYSHQRVKPEQPQDFLDFHCDIKYSTVKAELYGTFVIKGRGNNEELYGSFSE